MAGLGGCRYRRSEDEEGMPARLQDDFSSYRPISVDGDNVFHKALASSVNFNPFISMLEKPMRVPPDSPKPLCGDKKSTKCACLVEDGRRTGKLVILLG
jgi:hypothetical protein